MQDITQGSLRDHFPHAPDRRQETPVLANRELDPRRLACIEGTLDSGRGQGDRLVDEYMLTGLGRRLDLRDMLRVRCGQDNGVDPRIRGPLPAKKRRVGPESPVQPPLCIAIATRDRGALTPSHARSMGGAVRS